MAVTAHASGTQTATISTEHELSAVAVAGVFTLHVDTVNMADGDYVELRVKQKILSGGTARTIIFQGISDAQPADDAIWYSIPISNDLVEAGALSFTLKQVSGTGRNFPWKILKHG